MNKINNKVIIILGPTSSGKTKLAVRLAKKFNGEIVSADSRQVYRGMDIGTGKDLKEYGKVKHHLLDVASPKSQFSLAKYQKLAYRVINNILAGAELRKAAPENKNGFNLEELKKEFSKSVDGLGDRLEEVERWSKTKESQAAGDNDVLGRNLDNLIGSIEARQATGTSATGTPLK